MSDKLRWRVAYALNSLPWLCWADLVGWALKRTELRDCRVDALCRQDVEGWDHRCYCGKVRA